jgi:hypothetical protein
MDTLEHIIAWKARKEKPPCAVCNVYEVFKLETDFFVMKLRKLKLSEV